MSCRLCGAAPAAASVRGLTRTSISAIMWAMTQVRSPRIGVACGLRPSCRRSPRGCPKCMAPRSRTSMRQGSNGPADAAIARRAGTVCAILTADCLPVVIAADTGESVAAAHAGWRGLAAGVLEATVRALGTPPGRLLAWLGPAIGPEHFEVGAEVRDAFLRSDPEAGACLQAEYPRPIHGGSGDARATAPGKAGGDPNLWGRPMHLC